MHRRTWPALAHRADVSHMETPGTGCRIELARNRRALGKDGDTGKFRSLAHLATDTAARGPSPTTGPRCLHGRGNGAIPACSTDTRRKNREVKESSPTPIRWTGPWIIARQGGWKGSASERKLGYHAPRLVGFISHPSRLEARARPHRRRCVHTACITDSLPFCKSHSRGRRFLATWPEAARRYGRSSRFLP